MNGNDASYFSLENLRDLSGIDEHLDYAEKLIVTFGKETEQYAQLCTMLEQIKEKQNDKKLNISVIGEFTSGKSTFINALLGKELLVSSMMQGTTVASTIIEYSVNYELVVKRCGTVQAETLHFNDFPNLKKVLEKLTTDPVTARTLEFVHVFMPADILKKNIRIIDTPGTNVTEAWHEEVTIRTLNQMSDLSIILISAQKPASETLLNFLSSQLSGILPQCVFVVSMLDLIRPKERRSMMQFVKAKLENELELENAIVLPYVSTFVLGDEENGNIDAALLEESLETEKKLLQHTARQRTVAQTKKLLHLIQTIYIALEEQMKGMTQKHEDRLAELERTRQTDLESFIKLQTDACKQDFEDKIAAHAERLENNLSGMSSNAKHQILRKLDALTSIDSMKSYLTGNGVKNDCTEETAKFTEKAMEIMIPAEVLFESEMYYFENQFKKLYQKLKILEVDVKLNQQKPDCSIAGISADFSSTASYISEELSKENRSFWGGAAAGATAGTAILPGLGTVIGGVIGMVAGASSNEKMNAVRKNCKEKLNVPLTNYFDTVESRTVRSVEKYLSNMKKTLERQFQRYLKAYLDEVNHQISMEENERAGVMKKINTLKQEMRCLENRRRQLESFYVQMDKLGRNTEAAYE